MAPATKSTNLHANMPKKTELEITEKYTYNPESDTYIINMKHRVKPYVISGYKIRAIKRSMSNLISSGASAFDIRVKFSISEEDFDGIKKAFDLGRETFPLTDEEIESLTPQESLDKLLEEKKTSLIQAYEKADWKRTQDDAAKWRDFQAGVLDPFSNFLDSWKVPTLKTSKLKTVEPSGKTLCISLADLHWGNSANARYMYNDKGGWDSKRTSECVGAYCESLLEKCEERKYAFDEVAIFIMGDILHSVSGKTCRGTELKFDCIREEQFEYALNSLSEFFCKIVSRFCKVKVFTTIGNHNPEAEIGLYRALEMLFNSNKNVEFKHLTSRPASFVLKNTLILMEHGQDSSERAYVPSAEGKLENHVQNLLLQKPELLTPNIKSKLFIMGDKHTFKHLEFDNFEFIQFSTIQLADEHAAVNNWCNRARQSCLVLDDTGLAEVLHFYTDSLMSR